MIYIRKQGGLYQNKVNSSLVSIHNSRGILQNAERRMAYKWGETTIIVNCFLTLWEQGR